MTAGPLLVPSGVLYDLGAGGEFVRSELPQGGVGGRAEGCWGRGRAAACATALAPHLCRQGRER